MISIENTTGIGRDTIVKYNGEKLPGIIAINLDPITIQSRITATIKVNVDELNFKEVLAAIDDENKIEVDNRELRYEIRFVPQKSEETYQELLTKINNGLAETREIVIKLGKI